jgi:hypothetical protein
MAKQVESTHVEELAVSDKPSGPAAAAFVAAGIGSLVMGITVNVVEQSVRIKELIGVDFNALFRFDQNFGLGSGVGPLSGKVIVSVLAFLISWAVLFLLWRRRDISVGKAFAATLVLVAIGFALTFPPVFYFLAGE